MKNVNKIRKMIFRSIFVSLFFTATIGIYTYFLEQYEANEFKFMFSGLCVLFFSMTALACTANYAKHKLFTQVGISISIISMILVLITIWITFDNSDYYFEVQTILEKSRYCFILLSFVFAHISLVLTIPTQNPLLNKCVNANLMFIGIVSTMTLLVYLSHIEDRYIGQLYQHLLIVANILYATVSIFTPMLFLSQLSRKTADPFQ